MEKGKVMMNENRTHLGNIDLLRCISTLAVIGIHVISGPLAWNPETVDPTVKTILQSIFGLLLWAVPIFFMITGYCAGLRKTLTYSYAVRKIKKYILALFTVGLFYALLERIFNEKALNLSLILGALLDVINGKTWGHMWFVYAIIGVYLCLPPLFTFMKNTSEQLIFTAIVFVFSIVLPWLCEKTDLSINIYFPLCNFAFYVCFGMLLSISGFHGLSRKTSIIAAMIMIIIGALPVFMGFISDWYTDFPVCMMAMGIFIIFILSEVKYTRALGMFAECTWGMYLIHPFFINLAVKFFKIDFLSVNVGFRMTALYIVTVCLSFLCTYILRKIPVLKAIF